MTKFRKILQTCGIIATSLVVLWSGVSAFNLVASAATQKDLDNVKKELTETEKKIAEYRQTADDLNRQAKSLSNEIAKLKAEQNMLVEMINASQEKYDQLVLEIELAEKKIQDNKDALGLIITEQYLTSKVSPIERLASSKNLSSYVDKEVAMSVVGENLKATVDEIKTLKEELETKKAEQAAVIEEQKAQKKLLDEKKAEQERIWNATKGQEAEYQRMQAAALEERQRLMAEQARIMAELSPSGNYSNGVNGWTYRNYSGEQGCAGHGYPNSAVGAWGSNYGCNYKLDNTVDEWSLYNRECVSYAAYAMYYRFGKDVRGFQGRGDAKKWPDSAPALMGARADNFPEVGSVAIKPTGTWGHAMVVEAILNDGWIRVSQFNFKFTGTYSTMEIPADSVVYVHFRDR